VLTLIHTLMVRAERTVFLLSLTALICLGARQVIFWTLTYPMNVATNNWTITPHRSPGGRPRIAKEVRDLIRRISLENPLWGATKIHGELLKLGIQVAQSTVSTRRSCTSVMVALAVAPCRSTDSLVY
jgi:hypothetical protein